MTEDWRREEGSNLYWSKKKETGLIPLEPVSSNNLLKYSLNKSELLLLFPIPCQKWVGIH